MPTAKADTERDINLSHFRANVRRTYFGTVVIRAGTCERRVPYGWQVLSDIDLPDSTDLYGERDSMSEMRIVAKEINRLCKQLLMQDLQEMASMKAHWIRRQERKEKARKEYREYLDQLPLSADDYLESADRFRYAGDPDGHVEPRSVVSWLDLQAEKRWPEATEKKKAALREEHDLGANTSLL